MQSTRRRFLKQSVAAATAVLPASAEVFAQGRTASSAQSHNVLRAVAEIVLPVSELHQDGIDRVLAGFQSWQDGFEPVAEMDHPYLTSSEIQYGPADPRPRWQAQLEALELEAQKKYGFAFAKLEARDKRQMIERAMRDDRLDRLPNVAEAHHIAVALAAYFYGTSEATDLCYDAEIGRWGCHGLEAGVPEPQRRQRR
jgi:hypothetical protein